MNIWFAQFAQWLCVVEKLGGESAVAPGYNRPPQDGEGKIEEINRVCGRGAEYKREKGGVG